MSNKQDETLFEKMTEIEECSKSLKGTKNILNIISSFNISKSTYDRAKVVMDKINNYNKKEDRTREEEIHNKLDCNFIRIKKGQELEGINKINKYILEC